MQVSEAQIIFEVRLYDVIAAQGHRLISLHQPFSAKKCIHWRIYATLVYKGLTITSFSYEPAKKLVYLLACSLNYKLSITYENDIRKVAVNLRGGLVNTCYNYLSSFSQLFQFLHDADRIETIQPGCWFVAK